MLLLLCTARCPYCYYLLSLPQRCDTRGELLQIHHNKSKMEDDTISSNIGKVIGAALTNTSEDVPRKKMVNLQTSSDKCQTDEGITLCKVDGCEKYSQREREGFCVTHNKLLADAGGHVHNEVGSSVAATSSSTGGSRKRERTNNVQITNLLSRQVLSLVPNIKIPEHPLSIMKKWKAHVGNTDLRPCFGCSFCGPTVNENNFDIKLLEGVDLCPFCTLLQEEGWTQKVFSTNKKYMDPNGTGHLGVTSFLRVTTSIVQEKVASTCPEDLNNMVWKLHPVAEYPDYDESQKSEPAVVVSTKKDVKKNKSVSIETKRPSLSTNSVAGDDEFHGLSITSLAASLSKEKQLPESDPFLTGRDLCQISRRKVFISHPDPRPITSCSWCGVDKDMEKLCPICDSLKEHGWSSYSTSDQLFKDHNNERHRCVKNFLLASTDYIVKAMNAMPEKDRLRLIGQYESFNEGSDDSPPAPPQKRQRNNAETNDPQTFTSKRSKQTTIELPSISQLLTQDNGLEGVLKADLHSIYNLHFGSNANIAAKILTTLGKGDIPPDVKNEVPLLRSNQAIQQCSNGSDINPSRFVGVFRVVGEESNYAVGIPEFRVDCPTTPRAATVNNGQLCLLRVGIKEEKTAGQLFAYMYRALYGTKAFSVALKNSERDLTSQVNSGGQKDVDPKPLEMLQS